MITPGHWNRRRLRWNSVGSAAFALTVLVILGLGGGFLLAFLPFNSVDRSATAPRNLPDLPSLPIQRPTPSTEILREAEFSNQSALGASVALTTTPTSDAFELTLRDPPSVVPSFYAGSLVEELVPENFEMLVPMVSVASDGISARIPATVASVGAFEAEQIAVVPEPATWRLLISAMLGLVLLLRRRRNLRGVEPNSRQ